MDRRDHEITRKPRLDLDAFLFALRDERYVIAKSFELDEYSPGSDLDLLCEDSVRAARIILEVASHFLPIGYEVRVSESHSKQQVQIDLMLGKSLEYRFDLYQRLPVYPRVKLKNSYFDQLIADRRTITRTYGTNVYSTYTLSDIDDMVVRYVEYCEFFHVRADKIKHLKYIMQAVRSDAGSIGFLARLHRFTDLPKPDDLKPAVPVGGWRVKMQDRIADTKFAWSPYARRLADLTVRTLRNPVSMGRKLVTKITGQTPSQTVEATIDPVQDVDTTPRRIDRPETPLSLSMAGSEPALGSTNENENTVITRKAA